MKLDKIIIPTSFKNSTPSPAKVEKHKNYYLTHGKPQKKLCVDQRGVLRDGYIDYLVMREYGVDNVEVDKYVSIREMGAETSKKTKTIYVFGKHKEVGKEYCWKVFAGTKNKKSLVPGSTALVRTSGGIKPITITRVEKLYNPPVIGMIRKVVKGE